MYTQLASKLFSPETLNAIHTIRDILTKFKSHHGVRDLFNDYPTKDVLLSFLALSRLQRYSSLYQQHYASSASSISSSDMSSSSPPSTSSLSSCPTSVYSTSSSSSLSSTSMPMSLSTPSISSSSVSSPSHDNILHHIDNNIHHGHGHGHGHLTKELIDDLAHYSIFANAAYGWKLRLLLSGKFHYGNLRLLTDRISSINTTHIVDMKWKAKTHRPAYFIVRDVQRQNIVLSIRGTLSARDVLSDLCCTVDDFCIYNAPGSNHTSNHTFSTSSNTSNSSNTHSHSHIGYSRAHHGMLESARGVELMTRSILEQEFKSHPDYNLVIVGHSLGGGVAAILGTMWQYTFPGVKVYAYGCPCVGPKPDDDNDNSNNEASMIVSVVGEGDPFSTLSLGHLADLSVALSQLCEDETLRNEILSKTQGYYSSTTTTSQSQNDDNNHDMSSNNTTTNNNNTSTTATSATTTTKENLKWCFDTYQSIQSHLTNEKLYPPGRILYMSVRSQSRNMSNGHSSSSEDDGNDHDLNRSYGRSSLGLFWGGRSLSTSSLSSKEQVTLTEVNANQFDYLMLHPGMFDVSRHVPNRYESALRDLSLSLSLSLSGK